MLVRDLEGSDPSPRPERVAALTECAHRFAGHEWTDKVFFWSSSEFIQVWQYSFFSQDVAVWSGVMPLSPDDFPIIGRTAR